MPVRISLDSAEPVTIPADASLRQKLVDEIEAHDVWAKSPEGLNGGLTTIEKVALLTYLHKKLTGRAPGR